MTYEWERRDITALVHSYQPLNQDIIALVHSYQPLNQEATHPSNLIIDYSSSHLPLDHNHM